MALFGDFANMLGLGGGGGGYAGLTPDQQQMVTQQGWYPRPDMVLPTGQSLQQPQGYSNLTPAQASTVNALGYYSNADATQPQNLWDKFKGLAGSPGMGDLQKAAAAMTPHPLGNAPTAPVHYPGLLQNPNFNIYRPPVLDPKLALQHLQRGY